MLENGKFASVHYTGTLSNGEVFDSSLERNPLEFEIGKGAVIPAFEEAVKNMNIDEEKEIFVKADEAYGQYRDDMIQQVPLDEIKQFLDPQQGMTIQVNLQNGQTAPAMIKEVTESNVALDFNHPLAGQDLNFKLKLVAVNNEAQQATHDCGEGGCSSCGGNCG